MIKAEKYFAAKSNLEKNDILVSLAFEIRDLLDKLANPVKKTEEKKVLNPKEFTSGPRSRHKRKVSQQYKS